MQHVHLDGYLGTKMSLKHNTQPPLRSTRQAILDWLLAAMSRLLMSLRTPEHLLSLRTPAVLDESSPNPGQDPESAEN